MNPDGSQDKSQYVFTGADDGSVLLNDRLLFSADEPGIREYTLQLGDWWDVGTADRLKLSGIRRFKLIVLGSILGGSEDCIDINHCQATEVDVQSVEPKGRNVLTCKGGSKNVKVKVGVQLGHGTETDYDLGNWADQNPHERTTGVVIEVGVATGVVQVRQLHATKPTLLGPAQFKLNSKWSWCFNYVYRVLKALHLA